jgi:hypothetical protein
MWLGNTFREQKQSQCKQNFSFLDVQTIDIKISMAQTHPKSE